MAKSRSRSSPVVYFVSTATRDRRPLFQISRLAELFIQNLLALRARGEFKLHAFLVLPDQVHLVLTPGSHSLEETVDRIKTTFAERISPRLELWSSDFLSHSVSSVRDLETLRAYLHQVPVRARLAATPELYPYSSACRVAQNSAPSTTTSTAELAS